MIRAGCGHASPLERKWWSGAVPPGMVCNGELCCMWCGKPCNTWYYLHYLYHLEWKWWTAELQPACYAVSYAACGVVYHLVGW